MQSNNNRVVLASAGSRKTTFVVEEALRTRKGRVLITTYTNENVAQMCTYLTQRHGHIPAHVDVMSWYSFLLHHGIRPYQNQITTAPRVNSILFGQLPPEARFIKKSNVNQYYLSPGRNIYRDRVADFVHECNARTGGLIVNRLGRIYCHLLIDELQDLSGYDLEFLEQLFKSALAVTAVGDPRQATYSTNNAAKNKQYRRSSIADWVVNKGKCGLFRIEERTECYRSNQIICDFADALYPDLPKTISKTDVLTGHDGVFYIPKEDVAAYVSKYSPQVLRYNKRTDTMDYAALNIGLTKGRTYDRVLIFPTEPMKRYLKTRSLAQAGDLSKLYVAITRAKYSVAFLADSG